MVSQTRRGLTWTIPQAGITGWVVAPVGRRLRPHGTWSAWSLKILADLPIPDEWDALRRLRYLARRRWQWL